MYSKNRSPPLNIIVGKQNEINFLSIPHAVIFPHDDIYVYVGFIGGIVTGLIYVMIYDTQLVEQSTYISGDLYICTEQKDDTGSTGTVAFYRPDNSINIQ